MNNRNTSPREREHETIGRTVSDDSLFSSLRSSSVATKASDWNRIYLEENLNEENLSAKLNNRRRRRGRNMCHNLQNVRFGKRRAEKRGKGLSMDFLFVGGIRRRRGLQPVLIGQIGESGVASTKRERRRDEGRWMFIGEEKRREKRT